MSASEFLNKILPYYRESFDIQNEFEYQGEKYDALASLHAHVDKYVLVKKAQLWAADSHEHCLFSTFGENEISKENIYQMIDVLKNYMEPELVCNGEKMPPKDHMYTYLSLILITEKGVSNEVIDTIRRFRFKKYYQFYFRGYAEGRILLLDLSNGSIYTNRAGRVMKKMYQKMYRDLARMTLERA